MTSRADLPRWKRLLLAGCDGFNSRFPIGAEIVVWTPDKRERAGRLLAPGAHIAGSQVVVRIDSVRGAILLRDVHPRSWVGRMADI